MRRLLPLPFLAAIALAAIFAVQFDNTKHAGATGPNTWTTVASMSTARVPARAVTLPDGRVLVISAAIFQGPVSAEIYDPVANTWTPTAAPSSMSGLVVATSLGGGRVLVSASKPGDNVNPDVMAVQIYDAATNSWAVASTAPHARSLHTMTLLADGRVLFAGGYQGFLASGPLGAADVYDPTTNTWTSASSVSVQHVNANAVRLTDGRVLLTAAWNGSATGTASEIYDPATNSWSYGGLANARQLGNAVLLQDGRVLVAGGNNPGQPDPAPQVYDPASNTWSNAGNGWPAWQGASSTLLNDGNVLFAAGDGASQNTRLYLPASNDWASLPMPPNQVRHDHAAALLQDGRVLIAGGRSLGTLLSSAEIFEPGAAPPPDTPTPVTPSPTPDLSTPTNSPTATSTRTATSTPTPTNTALPGFPDLVVQNVTDNQNFNCTRPGGIQITIANIGDTAAGASTAFVNGGFAGSQSVSVPAIGANSNAVVYSSIFGPGSLNYTITVDSTGVVAESDETNNVASGEVQTTSAATCTWTATPTAGSPIATATFTPTPTSTSTSTNTAVPTATSTPALPDLVVLSISDRQQGSGSCNTPAGLRIVVQNVKAGAAGASSLLVSAGSGPSDTVPVPALSGNQAATLFSSVTGIPSSDTYTATADSAGVVAEANEANNTKVVTIALATTATCTPSPTPDVNTPTVTPTPTGFTTQDTDGDGLPGNADNCPFVYNPDQANSDRNFVNNHPLYAVDDGTLINSDVIGDACDNDLDNDGLPDSWEADGPPCAAASGPTNADSIDTDHDGYKDGYECGLGFDPANAASKPPAPAPGTDPDNDGLSTAQEMSIGTDPNVKDTDGDGLQDGWEVRGYASSPLSIDSDGDGVKDGCEAASLNVDSTVNSGDQGMLAFEIRRPRPPASLANFDLNKDGTINSGDQGFQASRIGPGKCP